MPQPLNANPGSQLASEAPEGFESLDLYDASLKADAAENTVEVPEDLLIPEGEEEGAKPEGDEAAPEVEAAPEGEAEAEAEGAEDFSVEVDGQILSSDDLRQLLTERNAVSDIYEEYGELKESAGEAGDLAKYRELAKFFEKNPDIRRKLEAEVGEFEKLAEANLSTDPHVRSLQKRIDQLEGSQKEVEVERSTRQIDGIFGALEKKYPDIVDAGFRQTVLAQVYGTFKGDPRFGVKTLAAAAKATAFMMEKATAKATQNGKDAAVRAVKKPGVVRLVPPGKRADAKPKAKDYMKMSNQQVKDAFVDEMATGD
jgi:hypothetical protein